MAADWREQAELQKANNKKAPAESSEKPLATIPPPSLGYLRRVSSPPPQDSASVALIRQDLVKAQQERADLQARLEKASQDLDSLKTKARQDTKRLAQATANVNQLTLKLRDRDEELKGKTKLVENVQDENVTLTLQLNLAEQQQEKLKKENKELVDRWMAKKGKEADRMNDESKFR
ncbi:Autophagy protein 16 [Cyphellophora attinorum]|uniref:Autophagy protein 16 n=1 Tax=Cyphellophora attinorum TaxID=1664694 RepID=A0A0N1H702_9EURO|nr:Autophagy protein 16 [Phialophora attinorum]KPI38624.1 Autophagy protein 16 [Phialophora attinorum]